MKEIDVVVWKEQQHYVSQCLNVDVSSFGDTRQEAMRNLKEAVELYFEGESTEMTTIDSVSIGKEIINA